MGVPGAGLPGRHHPGGAGQHLPVGGRHGVRPGVPERPRPTQRLDQRRARARRSTRSPSSATRSTTCRTSTWRAAAPPRSRSATAARRACCRAWITPAGGGVWRTDEHPAPASRSGRYLGGPLGINAAGAVTHRPQRPDRQHDLRRHRRGQHLRLRLRRRRRALQVDQRRRHLDRAAGQGRAAAARASARSSSSPATRRRCTSATTTALRGMSSVCCTGVTRPAPDAAKWGLYKSTDGGRTWTLHPQRLDGRGRVHRQRSPSSPTPRPARRAACATSSSTRATRDIVYASSYARGIWRSTDAGATWTQIKPSLNAAGHPDPAGVRRDPAAQRQDPHVRLRGQHRHAVLAAVPQRRRRHRHADVHRPDQRQPGRPRLRHATTSAAASAGTTSSSTRPDGHPDIVYTGGSYVVRRDHRQQAGGRAVHRRRGDRHRHDLRRHRRAAPERPAPRPARPRHQPAQPVPVLRGQRRRRHALQRPVRRPLGLVRRPAARPDRRRARPVPADAVADPVASWTASTRACRRCSSSACRSARTTTNLLQGGTQDNGTWENNGNRTTVAQHDDR